MQNVCSVIYQTSYPKTFKFLYLNDANSSCDMEITDKIGSFLYNIRYLRIINHKIVILITLMLIYNVAFANFRKDES